MSSAVLAYPGPKHRRPRLTLYRYLARETLRPTAFALFGLTAIVLTTKVLEFSELVINRGVEGSSVASILFFEAVPVAARMLPFAVLVGSLFALGRMGADREILALEASGIAPVRLSGPVVAFAAVVSVVALAMGIEATPWSSRALDSKLEAISREKPWANLRPGVVQRFGGWQLDAREVSAAGDRLRGVMLWTPEIRETIFAQSGPCLIISDDSLGAQRLCRIHTWRFEAVPALICKEIPIQFTIDCNLIEPHYFPGIERKIFPILMRSALRCLRSLELIPLFISNLATTTGCAS